MSEAGIITEEDLKKICEITNWHLAWGSDYFSEEKYNEDIFNDLLQEQRYGFDLDWKFFAQDVLDGIRYCTTIDVTIVSEILTIRTLKPFNKDQEMYRTVTLARGDSTKTITYTNKEPLYLAQEIMHFAGRTDTDIASIRSYSDTYYVVLVKPGINPKLLWPHIVFEPPITESESCILVEASRPATDKYFYMPILTTNLTENPTNNSAGTIDALTYKNGETLQPNYYASHVQPGQTLAETIKRDLMHDFHYQGIINVADYRLFDTAKDKHGNKLPRLIVNVQVDQFKTEEILPIGTATAWHTFPLEQFTSNLNLGFDMRELAVERSEVE